MRRSTPTAYLVLGILVGFLTGWGLSNSVHIVNGATVSNLTSIGTAGDWLKNYDFTEQTDSNTRVDWPVTMLFLNNASIGKVKAGPLGNYQQVGSTKNALLNDSGTWVWDTDKGVKKKPCSDSQDPILYHIRVYADSDDRMYNTNWGYYVFGTTHEDRNECTASEKFGWSEDAETEIRRTITARGYSTIANWSNCYNPQSARYDPNDPKRYWQNSGSCTKVTVP